MRLSSKKLVAVLLLGVTPALALVSKKPDTRQRIVVADTGAPVDTTYLCSGGHVDLTGKGMGDIHGHGSNIAGIISKYIDKEKQCIVIVKWYHTSEDWERTKPYAGKWMGLVLRTAIQTNPFLINLSLSGDGWLEEERMMIDKALKSGIIVVVSAGNEGRDLSKSCTAFPACYGFKKPNFHVVANYNGLNREPSSNYNGPVTDKENGHEVEGNGFIFTGTSQATAVTSGKIARGL